MAAVPSSYAPNAAEQTYENQALFQPAQQNVPQQAQAAQAGQQSQGDNQDGIHWATLPQQGSGSSGGSGSGGGGVGSLLGLAGMFLSEGGNVAGDQTQDMTGGGPVQQMPGKSGMWNADDETAQLSPGEYVVPAAVANFLGRDFFDNLVDDISSKIGMPRGTGQDGSPPGPAAQQTFNETQLPQYTGDLPGNQQPTPPASPSPSATLTPNASMAKGGAFRGIRSTKPPTGLAGLSLGHRSAEQGSGGRAFGPASSSGLNGPSGPSGPSIPDIGGPQPASGNPAISSSSAPAFADGGQVPQQPDPTTDPYGSMMNYATASLNELYGLNRESAPSTGASEALPSYAQGGSVTQGGQQFYADGGSVVDDGTTGQAIQNGYMDPGNSGTGSVDNTGMGGMVDFNQGQTGPQSYLPTGAIPDQQPMVNEISSDAILTAFQGMPPDQRAAIVQQIAQGMGPVVTQNFGEPYADAIMKAAYMDPNDFISQVGAIAELPNFANDTGEDPLEAFGSPVPDATPQGDDPTSSTPPNSSPIGMAQEQAERLTDPIDNRLFGNAADLNGMGGSTSGASVSAMGSSQLGNTNGSELWNSDGTAPYNAGSPQNSAVTPSVSMPSNEGPLNARKSPLGRVFAQRK